VDEPADAQPPAPPRRAGLLRVRWFRSRHEVVWLFLIALAIRAAAAWTNPAILNDSVSLLRSASRFASDGLKAALGIADHPLAPWIVSLAPRSIDTETAAIGLSVLAGAAAVWPLHVLTRRACGRHAATATCILYAGLPKAIGVASVPLTTTVLLPLFLSGLSLAVAAGLASSPRRRIVRLVSAGLICGLAYLCRPEGLVAAAGAVVAAGALARRGRRWTSAAIVAVAFLLVAAPYAASLSRQAGHLVLSPKKDVARFVGTEQAPADSAAPSERGAVADTLSAMDGALTAPIIALIVVGVVLASRWRHRHAFAPRVLLLAGAVVSILLVLRLRTGWGYGGAKHVLPGALLLLPFAGEALLFVGVFIRRAMARRRLAVVLACFLATALTVRTLLRPIGEDQADARRLGEAIAASAKTAGKRELVVATFAEPLVAYYADRSLRTGGGTARDVPLWGRYRALLGPGGTDELRAAMAATLRAEGAQWIVLDLFRGATPDAEAPGRTLAAKLEKDGVAGAPVIAAASPLTAFPVRPGADGGR
jgi:hypothetical protein